MIITKEEILKKLEFFNDDKFTFDAETHTYRYDGKLVYGTTSYLEKFIKPFDSNYWSKKKADELGITQDEMLSRWDATRDRSCDLGHMVHDYIENFYEKNSTKLPDDVEAHDRIEKFHKIYESRLKPLESIGSEIKVFSKKWNIAGTIDKIYLYENSIILGDWKTNKKIKTDKDFAFDYLLPPFNKYKANEINKYSLQLSIYALMLEEADIIIDYFFICHIPIKGEAKIYKLKDFRTELRAYFNSDTSINNSDTSINNNNSTEELLKLGKIERIW